MVVGHGDIGSVLPERDDLLFFASGVSNSQEIRETAYQREIDLLHKQDKTQHLVYFGSLAVYHTDTRYTRHKLRMETIVRNNFPKHTIVRLGNITWGTNPHTLINYFRTHPKAEVRNEYRYIVDRDEFLHWIGLIPSWSCEMNITGKRMSIKGIVDEYCHVGLHTK
jgi:hypothetical protein